MGRASSRRSVCRLRSDCTPARNSASSVDEGSCSPDIVSSCSCAIDGVAQKASKCIWSSRRILELNTPASMCRRSKL